MSKKPLGDKILGQMLVMVAQGIWLDVVFNKEEFSVSPVWIYERLSRMSLEGDWEYELGDSVSFSKKILKFCRKYDHVFIHTWYGEYQLSQGFYEWMAQRDAILGSQHQNKGTHHGMTW